MVNYRHGGVDMALPADAVLLLGVVNTKLRDEYVSLDALCDELCEDKNEIVEKLSSIGYSYNAELNQFI